MRYVAEHIQEELSVQSLAESLGVSRWTPNRRIEEALGRAPQKEINRLTWRISSDY